VAYGGAPYGGISYGGWFGGAPSYPLPPNPLSEIEDPTDVRVFLSSLIPSPAFPPTTLSSSASAGDSSISTVASITSGSYVVIDTGASQETNLTTGVSGSGPYTVSLSQPLAHNHASGATVQPEYKGQPILELPFNELTFTLTINQAGSFSVEFQMEQAAMRSSNWYNWTTPGKSFLWVQVGGYLIYGGRIMNRESVKTTQKCTITGNDFYSYWAQQMQFRDYTSFLQTYTTAGGVTKEFLWAGNYGLGAPAPLIAITLMRDKGDAEYFLPLLHTPDHGLGPGTSTDQDTWINAIPSANWIEFSAPISQMQTIDTLVQQMVQLGYPIGCDVFVKPTFDDSEGTYTGTPFAPYVNQYVAWPRAGVAATPAFPAQATNVPVLDLNAALEVKWTEDSTSQATNMWEQIGQNAAIWDGPYPNTFAMATHNWPLLEASFSHTYVNPVYLRTELLQQLQQGDKNIHSFPLLAPVVTVPCFAPSAFDLLGVASSMANDLTVANLYNPDEPNQVAPGLAFPPPGWTDTMRLVQADVTINDKGVSEMDLTLNMPPNRQNPPIYEPNPSF
jgi:hypothetical protein